MRSGGVAICQSSRVCGAGVRQVVTVEIVGSVCWLKCSLSNLESHPLIPDAHPLRGPVTPVQSIYAP